MAPEVALRAARHAALGDRARLEIVDELAASDRGSRDLAQRLDLPSNLLAHHLDVLERAGLITRSRSSGDGRRRYVHLEHDVLAALSPRPSVEPGAVLFVCSQNSARSPLAAALWQELTDRPASSAGTHPAGSVHPGALAVARRQGIDLKGAHPRAFVLPSDPRVQVVTVCDQAHEELAPTPDLGWWHWSIEDPVTSGTPRAFDAAVAELRGRIGGLVDSGACAS